MDRDKHDRLSSVSINILTEGKDDTLDIGGDYKVGWEIKCESFYVMIIINIIVNIAL